MQPLHWHGRKSLALVHTANPDGNMRTLGLMCHTRAFQAPAVKGLRAATRPALRASRNATRQVTKAEGKLSVSDLSKSDLEGKRVGALLHTARLTGCFESDH